MSQTDALPWRVWQEFKTEVSSIGTRSLQVSIKLPRIVEWIGEGQCLCVRVCVYVSVNMYVYMTVCEIPYF